VDGGREGNDKGNPGSEVVLGTIKGVSGKGLGGGWGQFVSGLPKEWAKGGGGKEELGKGTGLDFKSEVGLRCKSGNSAKWKLGKAKENGDEGSDVGGLNSASIYFMSWGGS